MAPTKWPFEGVKTKFWRFKTERDNLLMICRSASNGDHIVVEAAGVLPIAMNGTGSKEVTCEFSEASRFLK